MPPPFEWWSRLVDPSWRQRRKTQRLHTTGGLTRCITRWHMRRTLSGSFTTYRSSEKVKRSGRNLGKIYRQTNEQQNITQTCVFTETNVSHFFHSDARNVTANSLGDDIVFWMVSTSKTKRREWNTQKLGHKTFFKIKNKKRSPNTQHDITSKDRDIFSQSCLEGKALLWLRAFSLHKVKIGGFGSGRRG